MIFSLNLNRNRTAESVTRPVAVNPESFKRKYLF